MNNCLCQWIRLIVFGSYKGQNHGVPTHELADIIQQVLIHLVRNGYNWPQRVQVGLRVSLHDQPNHLWGKSLEYLIGKETKLSSAKIECEKLCWFNRAVYLYRISTLFHCRGKNMLSWTFNPMIEPLTLNLTPETEFLILSSRARATSNFFDCLNKF